MVQTWSHMDMEIRQYVSPTGMHSPAPGQYETPQPPSHEKLTSVASSSPAPGSSRSARSTYELGHAAHRGSSEARSIILLEQESRARAYVPGTPFPDVDLHQPPFDVCWADRPETGQVPCTRSLHTLLRTPSPDSLDQHGYHRHGARLPCRTNVSALRRSRGSGPTTSSLSRST